MRLTKHIEQTVREAMSAWPMYRDSDPIVVHDVVGRLTFIGYNLPGDSHWHANVLEDVFYLLKIKIADSIRGQGYGDSLYRTIEQIAQNLKCQEIRQTPSGWTKTGETRLDYLVRRGWKPAAGGLEVFKELNQLEVSV